MPDSASQHCEAYNIRIPEIAYWREQIKCQHACPVHTDARRYVRAIAEGADEYAYLVARGPNPLASICGRVCGAPCETACRRGELDSPIAIRALKRFVCEQFGPESGTTNHQQLVELLRKAASGYQDDKCDSREDLLPLLQALANKSLEPLDGSKSVGVIGSGPAGLAAAHDLALMGFSVTIYEMEEILAGMLITGVPEYRLPRDLIRAEIEVILSLGVKAITNCTVGKDISFPELREEHDAVVIAVGAKKSRRLPVPGADGVGVIGGVEFLRDVSTGNPPTLGNRIVVIGGGNVAYDVGRTVLRQTTLDAARSARRRPEVGEVHLVSLESLEEMPAEDIEIIHGEEEGIIRRNSLGPKEITLDNDGLVTGVTFQRCLCVFDEHGRFSPQFDPDDTVYIECDNVLISIGQDYDLGFIDADRDGLTLTERGLIRCDPETGVTSADDVYVAGDLAYGPKLLIHAVASGKKIARSIYERIGGRTLKTELLELHFPKADYHRERSYESINRHELPSIPVSERLSGENAEVEKCLSPEQARCEASRCLDCGINTIFDGERCVVCGGCVDVCPELCLRIADLGQIAHDSEFEELTKNYLEDFQPEDASFILKDETICIRCGLCAERCPTGAITMEGFQFKEKLSCHLD